MEGTSSIGVVCHLEVAAVGFNNGPADRQTHACSVFPRGIESLKDAVRIHFSKTAACIMDEYGHAIMIVRSRADGEASVLHLRLVHGLEAVA